VETRTPDVGGLVLKHRDAAGLTQQELARRAGVTQGTLSAIERNRRPPSLGTLCRLLDVLGLQLDLAVSDRTASLDAAIDAAAGRPMGDRLRRGRFDGVMILERLAAAAPVVEGAAGAVLHGAPLEVDHLDVAIAEDNLPALAAGLRSLGADRWSDQWRMWGPADPDPRTPGAMRWLTMVGEVRVTLVDTAPENLTVLVGDLLAHVRPLHDIEAADRPTARVLARLRERSGR
jgi:transcriptional regulator with XRE-family HTH domain